MIYTVLSHDRFQPWFGLMIPTRGWLIYIWQSDYYTFTSSTMPIVNKQNTLTAANIFPKFPLEEMVLTCGADCTSMGPFNHYRPWARGSLPPLPPYCYASDYNTMIYHKIM